MLGTIGGTFGIFCGASMVGMVDDFVDFFNFLHKYFIKTKKNLVTNY
jgi:hypothetical protein